MERQEYIDKLLKVLKDNIRYDISIGHERSLNEYLGMGMEIFKRTYRQDKNLTRSRIWSRENTAEITMFWMDIKQDLTKGVEMYIQNIKHRKLTKEINSTTAKATIKVAMQEAGLKHQFVGQTYRAKVSVLIGKNRSLTFYIPYSKMNEKLPQIIESLKLIQNEMREIGDNVTLNKVYPGGDWI